MTKFNLLLMSNTGVKVLSRWHVSFNLTSSILTTRVAEMWTSMPDRHLCMLLQIRGKKWCWPLFTRVLDMSVVKAWTINKLRHGEKAEIRCLLEFKRYICVSYLELLSVAKCSRANFVGHPSSEERTKAKDHIVAKRDKQRRCQKKSSNRKPLSFC